MLYVYLLGSLSLYATLSALILWRVAKVERVLASASRKKGPTRKPRKRATSAPVAIEPVIPPAMPLEQLEDPAEPRLPIDRSIGLGGAFADAQPLDSQPLRKLRSVLPRTEVVP